jgi:hypothetical protein
MKSKAMLRTENTTVHIIPHGTTSFIRIDDPVYSIQDMTDRDGSKPRLVRVARVDHPGIHDVPYVTMNPIGRKDYQIDVKLEGAVLSELDSVLAQACIVCVRYDDTDTIVYGLRSGLNWDPDTHSFFSDREDEPRRMRTEQTLGWSR